MTQRSLGQIAEKWNVNFFDSLLRERLPEFGSEFFTFLGSDYLLVHIKDKTRSQRETAIFSIRQQRAIRSTSELPSSVRRLFAPVNRQYLHSSPQVRCSAVSFSDSGFRVVEGGQSRQGAEYRYWASLFRSDAPPVHYQQHRWTPVAVTHSPQAGLCASADKLGEIHVWRASDARPMAVFQPINQHYHHVEWEQDQSGLLLSTRPFTASSAKKYDHNQYGAINTSFSFHDWKWLPRLNHQSTFDLEPVKRDAITNSQYRLSALGISDVNITSSEGRLQLFREMKKSLGADRVPRWGRPTCFRFLHTKTDGRLPFLVGTDTGFLLQFAIDRRSGRDVPRLTREFLGHEAQINSLAVSPDGKLLASASLDGTARIWRLDPVRTLADVSFKTDGTRIIDLGQDGSSGLKLNDGVSLFDGAPYYERIQKIQRGDYQPGDEVDIQVVRNVEVSGKYVGVTRTCTVRLVAAADIAEPVLNLFGTRHNAWVAWTPNGFFNASPEGARHVGWHVNRGRDKAADFSGVDQFKQQLYRPDLVGLVADAFRPLDELITRPPGPRVFTAPSVNASIPEDELALKERLEDSDAQKALEKAPNTREKYQEIRPPKVRVLRPYGTTKTDAATVLVEFSVDSPTRLPITDLVVRNNDRPLLAPPQQTSVQRNDGATITTYTIEVELRPGKNAIDIRAKHASAFSNVAGVTVESRQYSAPDSSLPRLYVLAVGVSKYEDPLFDLGYAAKDAEDFAKAWKQQEGQRYSEVISRVVTNKDATVDGIEDAFEWLSDQPITEKDFVFVFFAGHALFDEHDTWVFGSSELSEKKLTRTGIPNDRVNRLLEKELRSAATVILFLDTCHAGGIKSRGGENPLRTHHRYGRDIWRDSQRHVLASCTQKEVSMEKAAWGHGAFTLCLLQAMECPDCDIDRNGMISIEELKLKTREFVRKLTGGRQTPTASGQSLNSGVTELIKVH